MSKIFLYAHGGSGNHGCEAIVRSTVKMLDTHDITLISSRPDEDRYYGIDQICTLLKDTTGSINKRSRSFLKAYIALKCRHDYVPMEKLLFKDSFDHVQPGDIALSIGGDNYCYADVNKYIMLHDMMKERGARTILWGCSVEPEVAKRSEIATDLARYDLVVARESITLDMLRDINPNTVFMPDPAFFLGTKAINMSEYFILGNTVGINISPMVINNESIAGITEQNYQSLIEYILKETDMNIALIPHVVWAEGDDRIPLQNLYRKYSYSNRVCIVKDYRCDELKYVISKCRFFVGARTHSTIAAYSTCVPTLVLGYSVKARGIARDLFGTEEGYVLPVQGLKKKDDLLDAFRGIIKNEKQIKNRLAEKILNSAADYDNIRRYLNQLTSMEKTE